MNELINERKNEQANERANERNERMNEWILSVKIFKKKGKWTYTECRAKHKHINRVKPKNNNNKNNKKNNNNQ